MDNDYVVKAGDTLYGISKQFGVNVNDIMEENNMTSDIVELGSTINIPNVKQTTYTVQPGDTLYSIARNFGVSVNDIIDANNLNSNILTVGDILTIPAVGSNPTSITYIVKKGDNLYTIAEKYNVDVESIKDLNNLNTNNLSIGQQLKIPTILIDETKIPENNYQEYIVKKGDNLYTIAKRFNISVDDIKKINNLKNNELSIGQLLIIGKYPNNDNGVFLECYGNDDPSNYNTYIVKKDDNLYSIAGRYNISVNKLKEINNLKSDELSVGQILKIKEV